MSPAWLVKAPERPCSCGEEELADGNLPVNPFVLEGRRLHTEEQCGRVESFALGKSEHHWTWANPPEGA